MSKRTQTKPKARTATKAATPSTSGGGKKAQRSPAEIVKSLQQKMARVKKRLSPEQQLAELQKKVDSVNARSASRAVRSTEGGKKFILAMHAVRKAIQVQGKRDAAEMKVALLSAQAIIHKHAQDAGIVPKPPAAEE